MALGCWHHRLGRVGLIGMAFCLLATSLSGCADPTPTPEPVTVRLAHRDFQTEHYKALVQEFTELHPHITVELRNPSLGDADIFAVSPLSASGQQEPDNALSLDPFIRQDQSFDLPDFYPGTVELFRSEGQTWGIPVGVDIIVMYYNQHLLDRNDAPYPEIGWTWDDFLDIALAVRDPGAEVFGYLPTLHTFGAFSFIYQHGGRLFDDLENPTRTAFDDPLTIEAVEWYAKLITEHNVAPTPEQTQTIFGGSERSVYRGIIEGKAAMWMGMLSEWAELSRVPGWDINLGIVPLPSDARSVTAAMVEGYAVSAETQHRDASWRLITFLSRQMPRTLMPARKSLAESEAYEQLVGDEVASAARSSMESAVLITPDLVRFGEALGLFFEAVEEVIDGHSTAEEALSRVQRQCEQWGP